MGGIGRCREQPAEQKSSWTDGGRDSMPHKFYLGDRKVAISPFCIERNSRCLQACALSCIRTAEDPNKPSLLMTPLQVVDTSPLRGLGSSVWEFQHACKIL